MADSDLPDDIIINITDLLVLSSTADSLPEEIISNILSRLLVESISQCALVCKTWRNLIYNNDKTFSRMHSRRIYDHDSVAAVSSGKTSFVYLFDSGKKLLKHVEYDDDNYNKKPLMKFETIDLIPPVDSIGIIGSCNGLICISGMENTRDPIYYICNPMTKEFVILGELSMKECSKDYILSGFGYHPSTNEYKVVRIHCCVAQPLGNKPFVGLVRVYTLGSGNGWRSIEEITYKLRPFYYSNGILAKGALHWLDEEGNIMAFDLENEKFHFLSRLKFLPSEVKPEHYDLRVLGGYLRIIDRTPGKIGYHIRSFKKMDPRPTKIRRRGMWMLDIQNKSEQDIKEEHHKSSWSWEYLYSGLSTWDHNTLRCSSYPSAILKNGTIVLSEDSRQDLKSGDYDQIACVPRGLVRYVKSFASLKALGEKDAKMIEPGEGVRELPLPRNAHGMNWNEEACIHDEWE